MNEYWYVNIIDYLNCSELSV